MEIERHPHQRAVEAILVRGVEIQIAIAIAIAAAVRREAEPALIVFRGGLLPLRAPFRRAARDRTGLDRTGVGLAGAHVAAADETQSAMVEIVAVVIVDHHAMRAGRDERVEDLVLQDHAHARRRLIGIVAPDHAGIGGRVVRLADPGQEHEPHVVEHVRGE